VARAWLSKWQNTVIVIEEGGKAAPSADSGSLTTRQAQRPSNEGQRRKGEEQKG
jgi:hypothetical protein